VSPLMNIAAAWRSTKGKSPPRRQVSVRARDGANPDGSYGRSVLSGAESIANSIKESLSRYLPRAAVRVCLWSRTARLCSRVERRCSNETRSARSANRRCSNDTRSAWSSATFAFNLLIS
jgi:hypothetical protein